MIRIDSIWLAIEPMDMRAFTEIALARVLTVLGALSGTVLICLQTGHKLPLQGYLLYKRNARKPFWLHCSINEVGSWL